MKYFASVVLPLIFSIEKTIIYHAVFLFSFCNCVEVMVIDWLFTLDCIYKCIIKRKNANKCT